MKEKEEQNGLLSDKDLEIEKLNELVKEKMKKYENIEY